MSEMTPDLQPSSKRRRTVIITSAAVLAAIAIGVIAIFTAKGFTDADAQPQDEQTIMLIEETLPPGLELADPSELDALSDPIDIELLEWQNSLQTELSGNPNLGALAISPDRTVFTITWYGAPSTALEQQIAAAPDGLEVVIQPADFPPAELQQLVTDAMRPGLISGVEIALGGVENDGSGIHLGLVEEPDGQSLADVTEAIAAALQRTDVPIRVEVTGSVIPIAG